MRIVALALMVLPAFLPAALAGELVQRPGWVVLDTGQSFDGLSERLSEAIRAEKMGLVTQASASDGAAGQGITIPGNRVVGVYRNDYARRMLAASLAAGIEAPIRYYLTENRDGTATLSYRTPSAVFAPYFDEVDSRSRTLRANSTACLPGSRSARWNLLIGKCGPGGSGLPSHRPRIGRGRS